MKHGFSLIELLVVITLLGILAGFSISGFRSLSQQIQFRTEAQGVFNRLLETRDAALAGKICDGDGFQFDPSEYSVGFDCGGLETFSLSSSQIVKPNDHSQLSVSFVGDPFAMQLYNGERELDISYFEIQSTERDDVVVDIWTVCLETVKGFPVLYERQCDCDNFHSGDSVPNCVSQ